MNKNILHCRKSKKERIKEGHKFNKLYSKNFLDLIIKIMAYKLNPRHSKQTFNPVFYFDTMPFSFEAHTGFYFFFNKIIKPAFLIIENIC